MNYCLGAGPRRSRLRPTEATRRASGRRIAGPSPDAYANPASGQDDDTELRPRLTARKDKPVHVAPMSLDQPSGARATARHFAGRRGVATVRACPPPDAHKRKVVVVAKKVLTPNGGRRVLAQQVATSGSEPRTPVTQMACSSTRPRTRWTPDSSSSAAITTPCIFGS